MECVFCKIAQGEIKAEKIYEDENVTSFLDIRPRAPGHTLVIPKKHVRELIDLEEGLAAEVFKVTKRVTKMLKDALNPDGFNIGINDGQASGQEIAHLHVNIFPRFKGDGGKPVHYIIDNPPGEDISTTAEKIRRKKRP